MKFVNRYFPLTLAIVFPLLLIWQGLDFTDTGFLLTNYQQIFNDPNSIHASFRLWLTNIIGGIWTLLFGDYLGLIGYKFAGVLVVYATLYVSYLTLRPYIKSRYLYWGLFLSAVFINRIGYLLHYNNLTAFFYVLSAHFILKGLKNKNNRLVFISGFIMGLNLFIRLPNVLGFLIILGIFFYGYISKTSFSEQVRQVFRYILGYISALVITFILMYFLGHLDAYMLALKGVFSMLNDPSGHHSSGRLIDIFIGNHKMVYLKNGLLFLILFSTSIFLTASARFKSKLLQYGIILAISFAALYVYYDYYENWFSIIVTLVGIQYLVLLLNMFDSEISRDFRLVSFISLLILFLAPLGSNNGILNAVYGMYLAIPIVFSYIMNVKDLDITISKVKGESVKRYHIRFEKSELKLIKAVILIVFLVFTVQSVYFYTYRDAKDRLKMTYSIEHSELKGVFTTKERAQVVGELLNALPKYVNENQFLLAYEQIPLVHFLTKTRPYLYNSWPMLYSPDKFKEALNLAQKEKQQLPPIVRAKASTETHSWPLWNKFPDSTHLEENRKIMDDFIATKNYTIVWENSFFEILLPTEY